MIFGGYGLHPQATAWYDVIARCWKILVFKRRSTAAIWAPSLTLFLLSTEYLTEVMWNLAAVSIVTLPELNKSDCWCFPSSVNSPWRESWHQLNPCTWWLSGRTCLAVASTVRWSCLRQIEFLLVFYVDYLYNTEVLHQTGDLYLKAWCSQYWLCWTDIFTTWAYIMCIILG